MFMRSELELYLKDQLSRESLATIDAHLGSCQACSGKLAEQDKCLWYLAELSSDEDSGTAKGAGIRGSLPTTRHPYRY